MKNLLKSYQALTAKPKLIGDCLLVQEIPAKENKTKGGLYIPTTDLRQVNGVEANRPMWALVLDVGPGFYNEDGTDAPLFVKPGWVVSFGRLAAQWYSVFGPLVCDPSQQVGLVRESEVKKYLESMEAFQAWEESFGKLLAE